jgi:hypothetical protein
VKAMVRRRKIPEVCDAEGNKFRVKGFTYNRQGAVNGFYLSGDRGDKEIPLSEARFFKHCKRRR